MRGGLIASLLCACAGGGGVDLSGPWMLDPASSDGARVQAVEAVRRGEALPLDPSTRAMAHYLAALPAEADDARRLARLTQPLFVVDSRWKVEGSPDALRVTAPGGETWTGRLTRDRLLLTSPRGDTVRAVRGP